MVLPSALSLEWERAQLEQQKLSPLAGLENEAFTHVRRVAVGGRGRERRRMSTLVPKEHRYFNLTESVDSLMYDVCVTWARLNLPT
jgi:hypothetical protein